MAIHGVNWHFSALPQSHAHFLIGIDAFSAEKIGAIQRSAEKNGKTQRKLALFSATAVARTFFHKGFLLVNTYQSSSGHKGMRRGCHLDEVCWTHS
jgi:hypothetical protein